MTNESKNPKSGSKRKRAYPCTTGSRKRRRPKKEAGVTSSAPVTATVCEETAETASTHENSCVTAGNRTNSSETPLMQKRTAPWIDENEDFRVPKNAQPPPANFVKAFRFLRYFFKRKPNKREF